MSEGIVTLIIKAANQSVPDHRIDCNTEWSVLHLKDHLSSEHPSKPRVDEQRLIYSGQLLLDNILLRNILRYPSENNSYTIHLVCSPLATAHNTHSHQSSGDPNPRAPPLARNSAQTRVETNTNQSMAGQQPEGPLANTESTDGVRRRNVVTASGGMQVPTQQTIDASAYPSPTQMVANAFQASGDPMQQMATMQQMYAHYMAYMQYMQMGGGMAGLAWPQQMVQLPSVPNPPTSTTTTTTSMPTVDQAEQPQRQQEQNAPADPQQQQQQQQQPQQIRMNAQGGEVEDDDDDEGMGRDWLDWIYVLSRMVVLLSIVYFYSTVSRFMIVVCIAMLLYLYQAGWFRPARRVEQPREADENENENDNIQDDRNNNINNNNNNNDVPAEARNPGEEEGGAGDNQENAPGNEGTDRVVEEIPVRPSILALSWTFLTSLFTSLIPEQPQVI